ncbi:MAG: DUF896 domain-containing protein [Clostridia bacterium]|nr:DUF896 domain-containing protein [Clostridia bacterium]
MDAKGIARINELAAIAKKRPLTQQEQDERAQLRQSYLADFRKGFIRTLENTSVRNPDGTIEPLKRKNPSAD